MKERIKPKPLNESEIIARGEKGVDLLLNSRGTRTTHWMKNAKKRQLALEALRQNPDLRLSELATYVSMSETGLRQSVDQCTGRTYFQGGNKILKAMLERLDELGVDE